MPINVTEPSNPINPNDASTFNARALEHFGIMGLLLSEAASSGGLLTADDIEVGIWSPVLTDGTTAAQANTNGTYTKIGNFVRASGRIPVTSMAGVSGGLRISGLPFVIANTSAGQGAGQVARATGLNLASTSALTLFTQQGSNFVYLYRWSNAGTVAVQAGEVTDSADIQFMVVYQV